MLSRITRITTTVGPQVLGGCSLFRDAQTAPKVAPIVAAEQHFIHDHAAYCKVQLPARKRNSSSSCDPFFGIGPLKDDVIIDLPDTEALNRAPRSRFGSLGESAFIKPEPSDDEDNWMERVQSFEFSPSSAEYLTSLAVIDDSEDISINNKWDSWSSPLDFDVNNVKIEEPDSESSEQYSAYDGPGVVPHIKTEPDVPYIKPEPIDDYEDQPGGCARFISAKRARSGRSSTSPEQPYDDWDYQPVVKKRGVVLKPRIDDETERRRAMNRIAALRYRERKRRDKHRMKVLLRELEHKNCQLQQQERKLMSEIAKWKAKLQSV